MSAPVDPPETTPAVEPAVEPAAVTPPVEPPVNPGPWAADLTEFFGDNAEALAAADRYMREKVQPARTQFETETAPARELYKDLIENPEGTLAEVVEELYGPEVAQQFKGIFGDEPSAVPVEPTEPAATPVDEVPDWAKPIIEEHQARRDAELAEEGQAEYQQMLAELQTAHPDLTATDIGDGTDEKPGLIHPFVAAAGGDPEAAYVAYQAFKAAFAAEHGSAPGDEPAPTAPPVLGADGAAPATPPVTKEYKNIDEAMEDWFAEKRAVAPPVVGSA